MIIRREELLRREEADLAPYAVRSADSRGRRFAESEDPFRTAFQRDRDRVIHSSAYRRLGNKTQVFISFEGEHYRTRLTHTEEATQVAVTVARALAANPDLTEAISRAHDLGHAPFGHAGEDALAACMAGHGGFEHNAQTLRIVDELEEEYVGVRGLNLTLDVREGVMAHRGDHGAGSAARPVPRPSVEAQIADVADEIAYSCHDLQDGLASGLLRRDDLQQAAPAWWQEATASLHLPRADLSPDLERRRVKGYLINLFVTDLITYSAVRLDECEAASAEAVRALPGRVIDLSPPLRAMRDALHGYLFTHLYNHYEVVTMAEKARRLLQELFEAYQANPAQLPAAVRARASGATSLERAICDHIASMTDRGAVREHHRLFDMDAHILP
jgi:dGTPase